MARALKDNSGKSRGSRRDNRVARRLPNNPVNCSSRGSVSLDSTYQQETIPRNPAEGIWPNCRLEATRLANWHHRQNQFQTGQCQVARTDLSLQTLADPFGQATQRAAMQNLVLPRIPIARRHGQNYTEAGLQFQLWSQWGSSQAVPLANVEHDQHLPVATPVGERSTWEEEVSSRVAAQLRVIGDEMNELYLQGWNGAWEWQHWPGGWRGLFNFIAERPLTAFPPPRMAIRQKMPAKDQGTE
ncbi:uncharacterized protein LOC114648303 isoform X2 [Erpetoichthys calabaricus]|uniref:uncharacterized protein LOC114648303 isoform X2 n=1 Tax=Erpetoichthys calabaricus TaxID=27687 RepID=UPI002234A457|nr:uncharacterized protein LOC114648303 isoform X2 [Erpetoichthys calabaricus]